MGWRAVDNDGVKMWQRNDGVTAHAYQIDAIEKAESESLRKSINTVYTCSEYGDTEEYELPSFLQVCLFLIALIIFAWRL